MNSRRMFLRSGLAAGAALTLASRDDLLAAAPAVTSTASTAPAGEKPVLVAVRDGSRAAMLDKALAALGGLGAFLKPGQTVVIKPNIGWDAGPERGANTHPELVGHLVTLCLAAGARSVSVFDNTCDPWQRAYANSGIEAAVKAAGGRMVNGKDQKMYREVAIPGGVKLKSALVHELVLDSDVFFNVPVLKHHSGSLMSATMKNLMGVVWNRRIYHSTDLHQGIADFMTVRRPTLNILDAYHPMVRRGPRGVSADDCVEKRMLLASTDSVLLDAAGARILGHEPGSVTHVRLAAALKVGVMDTERADIRRLTLA
jgi:uncharacterized protein (DUF362 family)